jgi:hypothetical protein
MSAVLELPRYERELVPVEPDANGLIWFGCSDKRGPKAGAAGVLPETYYQLLGGVEAGGQDVAVAWEVASPGSYVKSGIPVHRLDVLVAGVAKGYGLQLAGHAGCAALGGRQGIAKTQKSGSHYLRTNAAFGGDMSLEDYERVTEAVGRIHDAGLIDPKRVAIKELKAAHPKEGLPDGIPFARLATTGTAKAFVVSHVPKHGFKVRDLTRTAPAYINTVPALDALHNAIGNVFPVNRDLLRMAYASRVGAISGKHILHNGEPYPLYVINADGSSRVYMPEDLVENKAN